MSGSRTDAEKEARARADAEGTAEFEHEGKFFGFNPCALCEDVFNAVDDYLSDMTDVWEKEFLKEYGNPEKGTQAYSIVEQGGDAMVEQLRKIFDTSCDKFEMYSLRNIFYVPTDLALIESGPMSDADEAAAQEEESLDNELRMLHNKLKELRKSITNLEREKQPLEEGLPHIETSLESFRAAAQAFKDHGITSPGQTMGLIAKQTRELRSAKDQIAVAGGEGGSSSTGQSSGREGAAVQRHIGGRALQQTYHRKRKAMGDASTDDLQQLSSCFG